MVVSLPVGDRLGGGAMGRPTSGWWHCTLAIT